MENELNKTIDARNNPQTTTDTLSGLQQQQTVVYGDSSETIVENVNSERDRSFLSGQTTNVPLEAFLSRPVILDSHDWNLQLSVQTHEFDPWELFQNQSRIKDKLANFAFASFDLKLRFSIAGTPFQYGEIFAAYVPYGKLHSEAASIGGARNQVEKGVDLVARSGASHSKAVAYRYYSTYPHVTLKPQDSQSHELVLPFVWHNNFMSVNGHNERSGSITRESLGVIRMFNRIFVQGANDTAPTSFNIKVTAWAQNVSLNTPTEFEPTSSNEKPKDHIEDEYCDGPISGPASAVAGAAGKLTNIPIIGPYARATEIGASAISSVARLFGYSNPRDVEHLTDRRLDVVGNMASMSGKDTSTTLACDPRQEITIDPRTVGLKPIDEMSFSTIVTREQFLTRCLWKSNSGQFTTAGAERIIFTSCVMPNHLSVAGTYTNQGLAYAPEMDTPMGHLARMFAYWKGSITYRVEVVASPYHQGKLKLQFDPFVKSGNVSVSDFHKDDINARYTAILDLSKTRDMEFTIPWTSYRPYLRTLRSVIVNTFEPIDTDFTNFGQVEAIYNSHEGQEMSMGIFTVSVFNELVSPLPTTTTGAGFAPVYVQVFVKGGDDLVFQQPNDEDWTSAIYRPGLFPTSSNVPPMDYHGGQMVERHQVFEGSNFDDDVNVFFGERIVSIRTLLKRYSHTTTRWPAGNWDAGAPSANRAFSKLRYAWLNRTIAPSHGSLDPFTEGNLDSRHSYASYLGPAYCCVRGSTRRKLIVSPRVAYNLNRGERLMVERKATPEVTIVGRGTMTGQNTAYLTANSWDWFKAMPHGPNGMIIQDQNTRSGIEVELPYYQGTRFSLGTYLDYQLNDNNETIQIDPANSQVHYLELTVSGTSTNNDSAAYDEFFACGEDFGMFWYLAPPIHFRSLALV